MSLCVELGTTACTVDAARATASLTCEPFNPLRLNIQGMNNLTAALQMLTKPEDIHGKIRSHVSIQHSVIHECNLLHLDIQGVNKATFAL